ncbi:MAG: hypothetical protein CL431_08325 [Acidimicrobiaceae bacterium]|jgi:hypothetical protein|nr:hypothetical protein [Acidimicrobiaceae bacterium]|tara:strand:+ start:11726 stop:12262 length:537 start_codon:yes stop_codon:yes gene_type:complete
MTSSHFGSVKHLIKRFIFSFLPARKDRQALEFTTLLNPKELILFNAQSRVDKKHSYRNVQKLFTLADAPLEPDIVIASALHDIGKIESGFGIFGRVFATCVAAIAGLSRVDDWSRDRSGSIKHRIAVYVQHPEIGAALLDEAESNKIAIAWARDHHKRLDESTLEPSLFATLSRADRV